MWESLDHGRESQALDCALPLPSRAVLRTLLAVRAPSFGLVRDPQEGMSTASSPEPADANCLGKRSLQTSASDESADQTIPGSSVGHLAL